MSASAFIRLPLHRSACRTHRAVTPTPHQAFSTLRNLTYAAASRHTIPSAYVSALRLYSSKSFPPHTTIAMPALSPTMTAGNIGVWQKKAGDEIAPGDVLVEIETDKAQMDFEMADEGILAKVLVDSGTKDVNVGTPIAVMVENAADVEKFADFTAEDAGGAEQPKGEATGTAADSEPAQKQAAEPESPPKEKESKPEPSESKGESKAAAAEPAQGEDRIMASPSARRLAHEKNIPLDKVKGTGPHGRIIKEDVLHYKPSAPEAATQPKQSTSAPPPPPPAKPSEGSRYTDIPVSNMRRTIATRLSESKQSIPHYYLTTEIDMTKLLALRSELNAAADGKFKISVNDFIIKASAASMKDVPEANSAWHGDFIRQYSTVDVSVAVATPNGLITPIVADVGSIGLATISNRVKELASKAREGKLAPHEYQGGTFTISNLGMFGIQHFTAIINLPQSCILAIGETEDKLVMDALSEKGFKAVPVMKVTLSCDHRTVDGAVGAQWLKAFKGYMEKPTTILL